MRPSISGYYLEYKRRFGDYICYVCLKPLARMGATVTGIDAVDKNVKIARLHAVRSLLLYFYPFIHSAR